MSLDILDQAPPHDLDAERAVIGAALWDPRLIDDLTDQITGPDFYQPTHEQIWAAILDLHSAGQPCDPITLSAELETRGQLEHAGGRLGLVEMYETAIPANAAAHAQIVHDRAVQRRTIEASSRIRQLGARGGDIEAMVTSAQALLDGIDPHSRLETASVADTISEVVDLIGSDTLAGLNTPWPDLNSALGGLQPGRLYCVGARPGVGKSLMGQALAVHWATAHQQRALLVTCEMPRREVAMRMLAQDSQVFLGKLKTGQLTDRDNAAIAAATTRMLASHALIEVCDEPSQSVATIRTQARTMARKGGLGLVVVDYLQLLTPPAGRKDRNREREVAESARGLKELAMSLGVPVVVMSQLNRQLGARSDKRPGLMDLRESGAIEQDCDVVLLLHEPDPDGEPNVLEVIVAKNRDGELTSVQLLRQGWVSTIASRPAAPVHRGWSS